LFSRIGHENFELLNHDVVEPLLLEGGYAFVLPAVKLYLFEYQPTDDNRSDFLE